MFHPCFPKTLSILGLIGSLGLGVLPRVATAQPETALPATAKVYGVIDAGLLHDNASASPMRLDSGPMSTAFIGLSSSETLDAGARVGFTLEAFLRNDTGESGRWNGDGRWSRAAHLDLSGGFGTIQVGRTANLAFLSALRFSSFGDSFVFAPGLMAGWADPRGAAASVEGDTGWDNSLTYLGTPDGGTAFAAQYATSEGNGGHNLGLSLTRTLGPTTAAVNWQRVEIGLGGAQESAGWLGLSRDLGRHKVFLRSGRIDDHANHRSVHQTDAGASFAIDSGRQRPRKLLIGLGRSGMDLATSATAEAGSRLWTLSLGLDEQLTERTDLYAAVRFQRLDEDTPGVAVSDTTLWGAGLRMRF
jgi:predicted porin